MKTALIIAGLMLLAGGGIMLAVAALNRVTRRASRREPADREPPSVPAPARRGSLRLLLVRTRQREPVHRGATEAYGAELAALRTADVSPELTMLTGVEIVDHTHHELAGVTDALDEFDRTVELALAAFVAPLDARTQLRLAAARGETGELDLAELAALLDAEEVSA